MDPGTFLRLVREMDGSHQRSQDQSRVLNTVSLGPGIQWVFDDAANNFTRFVPVHEPGASAEAEKDLGNAAYKEGKYEEAIQHYTNAIAKDRDNAVYYSNRAAAYMALEKWDQALQDANKTIALKPDWSRGYARKGALFFKQGKYMQAAAAYADALSLDSDDPELKKGLAKSEAAYRRELMVDHAKVDVGVQTTEVDEANLGAIIKANISMGEGAELLQNVIRLRQEHFFWDSSADQVVNALKDDMLVTSEFNKQLRRNKDVIQYGDFCRLQQQFYEKQDFLRDCATRGDKEQYDKALRERNEAEEKLMTAATASLDAYGRLAELEKKRAEYISDACKQTTKCLTALKTYCNETLPALPDAERALITRPDGTDNKRESEEITAVTAKRRRPSSPVTPHTAGSHERGLDAVRSKLQEYQEWKKMLMSEVGAAVAATNAAANHFYNALRQEEAAVLRNISLLHRGPVIFHELADLAEDTVESLQGEDVSVSLKHIRSQQADFESAYTNLLNISECRKQAAGLLQEEAELEKERLSLEKKRIKVQAEADWLKVKGEDGPALDRATQLVQEYKERIRRVVSRQGEVEQHLSDLAQSHQPELLWNASSGEHSIKNRHLKWVKGSGKWLNRSLMDFDITRLLGTSKYSKVFLATHHGYECVLKEIPMEDEVARKAFLNEVTIVTEIQHPYIVHINGVFQDGPMAYIVMPYYSNGTIRQYLETHVVTPWALQEILRQICSGVAHLHEHQVAHRDLKPSNVLMHGNQPLIADFGIAKDLSSELDSTIYGEGDGLKGTAGYLAPEVLAGGRHSFASDVWALGVLLNEVAALVQAKAAAPEAVPAAVPPPVLLPGRAQVTVAPEAVGSARLADLITAVLQRDPTERPSTHAILAHPYFAVSLLQEMSDDHTLTQSDQKLAALASFLQQVRAAPRRALPVALDRSDVLQGVAKLMDQLGSSDFLRPLFVAFRNEQAVDEGGVLAEMYTVYYKQCVARRLFVCSEDGDTPGRSADGKDDIVTGAFYLPNPQKASAADLKAFTVFGKVLLRSLLDNAPCPFQPSLALFKFLCGVDVVLTDLEQYDKVLAHQLRDMLLSKDDVAELCLDFGGLRPNGDEVPVTNENKAEYVKCKVQHVLIGQRQAQLAAIREGFTSHADLNPHLGLLSPMELMISMCGAQHIKADLLCKQLAFRGWPVASRTPKLLLELINGMSQNNLRRFLRLTTASCALPSRGLRCHISVVCLPNSNALPVGHTCSFQLDLPDYNDADKLREKMALALAHVDDPFGFA